MITLKEGINKGSKDELKEIKQELKKKSQQSNLNAVISWDESGDGVPILIKDNIQVKSWSITSGSKILQGYIAPYDATVIKKLRENGLSPFGRANMDEFAMGSTTESSFYGATLNPHDTTRVTGRFKWRKCICGSRGEAIAALGSDTGGSI